MTVAEIPTREVLGMVVPLPMVIRIVAAMRATYPDLTSGLDDDATVRAVVKHWVTSTLTNFEAQAAAAPAVQAVQEAEAERDRKTAQALAKALRDAEQIKDAPKPVVPPLPVTPPVDPIPVTPSVDPAGVTPGKAKAKSGRRRST